MASHDTAFRPLLPDAFHHSLHDANPLAERTKQSLAVEAGPADIVSLDAYKALKSLKKLQENEKNQEIQKKIHQVHDIALLLPLINEAHLRPVRFYRGLEEWLLGQDYPQDHA
jgi:hypothetical protein